MISDKTAKAALKKEAIGIREFLRDLDQVKVFDRLKSRKGTNASSFYVDVAELDDDTFVEIWLDRCAGDEFNYWIGVVGPQASIENLTAALHKKLKPKKHLTLKDYALKRAGSKKYHVYKDMKNADLENPFVERIRKTECYFGVYLFGNRSATGLPKLESSKARIFLQLLIVGRQDSNQEEWRPLEGRVKERLVKSRHREAAKREEKIEQVLSKSGGTLKCEVANCNFDFHKVYGKLGERYAHVHHKNALRAAKGVGVRTSLADLAIVCANCHAMIHRYGKCRKLTGLIPSKAK